MIIYNYVPFQNGNFSWEQILSFKSSSLKPQLHTQDFGPWQSYDSPWFVKSGYIGTILSSTVAPLWCIGVSRSSTIMILEESWWLRNLEDNATTSLNHLNLSGWIMVDCGRGLDRSGIRIIPSGTCILGSSGLNRVSSVSTIHPRLIQIHPESPWIQYDCPTIMSWRCRSSIIVAQSWILES